MLETVLLKDFPDHRRHALHTYEMRKHHAELGYHVSEGIALLVQP
jgi:hypothetical protein